MKLVKFCILSAVISIPMAMSTGCGSGGGVAEPAVEIDEMEQYLIDNPRDPSQDTLEDIKL